MPTYVFEFDPSKMLVEFGHNGRGRLILDREWAPCQNMCGQGVCKDWVRLALARLLARRVRNRCRLRLLCRNRPSMNRNFSFDIVNYDSFVCNLDDLRAVNT